LAVQPLRSIFVVFVVCRLDRDAIAVRKPLDQIAIAAALAAERMMRGDDGFAAAGAGGA
jgi:hypothetical protein